MRINCACEKGLIPREFRSCSDDGICGTLFVADPRDSGYCGVKSQTVSELDRREKLVGRGVKEVGVSFDGSAAPAVRRRKN